MITQKELKEQLSLDENSGVFTHTVSKSKRIKSGTIAGEFYKERY